jgi:hypothetical protein
MKNDLRLGALALNIPYQPHPHHKDVQAFWVFCKRLFGWLRNRTHVGDTANEQELASYKAVLGEYDLLVKEIADSLPPEQKILWGIVLGDKGAGSHPLPHLKFAAALVRGHTWRFFTLDRHVQERLLEIIAADARNYIKRPATQPQPALEILGA